MDLIPVLVNPLARGGRAARVWAAVEALLARLGLRASATFTRAPGHASLLAAEARRAGATRLLVVGGDGTLNEAAASLVGGPTVLSVIPAGSGNDLARSLGIPRVLSRALRWALDRPGRATDAALAGDRVWLNTAGVGFDATAARIAQGGPAWIKGSANYVRAVLIALATYRPVGLEVRVDGELVSSGPSMFTGLANGRYAAGGMLIAPKAIPDDGQLDVVGLNKISIPAFLLAFPKVYSGKHLEHPKVWTSRGRRVTITADRPVAAYADGEILGLVSNLEAKVLPGALLVAR